MTSPIIQIPKMELPEWCATTLFCSVFMEVNVQTWSATAQATLLPTIHQQWMNLTVLLLLQTKKPPTNPGAKKKN